MKTYTPTQIQATQRKWYVIDAKWHTLGRLSTGIATTLRGKNKRDFTPHLDNGDYVIVINCDKFSVSGNKLTQKMYHKHSGYLGWLTSVPLQKMLNKKPTRPLQAAVSWMLPKNKLRKDMLLRLKLFPGEEHTYIAQKPETLSL